MDINILLALQGLRDALGPGMEAFFCLLTELPTSLLTYLLPALLYYWFDKAAGQYLLLSFGLGSSVNSLVKNLMCAYRPWIRDARIHPAEAALPEATGYSFPSGHTQTMGSVWFGWGWYYRRQHRWLLVVVSVLTALVAFSRCFLGVHTPQDVAVGFAVSVVTLWLAGRLLAWAGEGRAHDAAILVGVLVYVVVSVAVLTLKAYPMDYVEGVLVVDPAVMVQGAYRSDGWLAGIVLGWFLERRYVNFSTMCSVREKVIRLACGAVLGGAAYFACQLLKTTDLLPAYYLLSGFAPLVLAMWAGPAAAQRLCAGERKAGGR